MSEQTEVMKSISDTLGMKPLMVGGYNSEPSSGQELIVESSADEIEPTQEEKEAEEDFVIVRENTKNILEQGGEALEMILRIASSSEHPRAFEVAANLIKTLTDSNKSLMELHEKRRQLAPIREQKKEETASITNNNVFVGTTAELLQLIKDQKTKAPIIEHGS